MNELSLRQLVRSLATELGEQADSDKRDIKAGTQLMERYNADLEEWRSFAFWDPQKYTRNLIATDNRTFTLMLLCWDKGQQSPIHDHAGSECWMRIVSGTAIEELYHPPQAEDIPLDLVHRKVHTEGSVCFINDGVGLHRITNGSQDHPLVTLHCYSPPFDCCQAFLGTTGCPTSCQVTYFSENGVLTRMH